MALLGYLICRTCKQYTCLGKWLRDDDDLGFGFWRGCETYEQLGLKTLNFLAVHTCHEIAMLTDEFYDDPDWDYVSVEEDLPADWPTRAK